MSTTRARELRKDLTASEKRLWYALRPLRQRGFHFRKQHPVGHFVVDFACLSYRLLVEVDGGVHDRPERAAFDAMRDEILRRKGFRVLHFPASAVMRDVDGVVRAVVEALDSGPDPKFKSKLAGQSPTLALRALPSPEGEGFP
ncbi:MAG: DUF559 domain-containing protein [Caulobacteraceae bacterium]